jgi:hypothetical protein
LPDRFEPLGVGLLAAGLMASGGAVSLRLRRAGQSLEERAESAGIVALAAFAALLAFLAMKESWDSGRLFFGVLSAVGLVGALLVLLPRVVRRIVVSLLVVFHFAGILTAVTCVPPPGALPPWISSQLWARVFRPYLMFAYVNNAYHFYSPEPGPPTLLWFRIQYEDNSSQWVKIPNREESLTRLGYQRLLALTESTSYNSNAPPPDFKFRLDRRQLAGMTFKPAPIPMPDNAPADNYREPNDLSKRMIASYASFVAHHYPHPTNPEVGVAGVKVYRILHRIIEPGEMAGGVSPIDKTTYGPFFMGEFDRDGNLKDPTEPFLYWYLPIFYANLPEGYTNGQFLLKAPPKGAKLINCMEIHAGDALPTEKEQP